MTVSFRSGCAAGRLESESSRGRRVNECSGTWGRACCRIFVLRLIVVIGIVWVVVIES